MKISGSHDHKTTKYLFAGLAAVFVFIIGVTVWHYSSMSRKDAAKDFHFLASLSPDTIIYYQENKPDNWKDYVAVISACNKADQVKNNLQSGQNQADRKKMEKLKLLLLKQLDANYNLAELDWTDTEQEAKKTSLYCRKLLDRYTIYSRDNYTFPLEKKCYYIDTFGSGREGGKRIHQGTDLFEQKGTPIYSVCPGVVEKIGWNRLGGERVGVRGEDGNYYYYAHLTEINKLLLEGKKIGLGDLIGTMGNTGDAVTTPDHLHFGIEHPNGEWINPYAFLRVWEYHLTGK